jgi:hypothetical protein
MCVKVKVVVAPVVGGGGGVIFGGVTKIMMKDRGQDSQVVS